VTPSSTALQRVCQQQAFARTRQQPEQGSPRLTSQRTTQQQELTSYQQERLLRRQEWLNKKSYKQGPPARTEGRCCSSSDCSAHRSGTSRVTTRVVSTGHYISHCRDRVTTRGTPTARTSTIEEVRDSWELYGESTLYEVNTAKIDCTKQPDRAYQKGSRVLFHSTSHKSDCKYCKCKHRKIKNCSLPPD
jgi:hypothetical protein